MKKFMLICAPMTSRSGYGAHARDLIKSFMEHDKYDIQVFDVPWGSTPRNALDKNNVDDKKMLDLINSLSKDDLVVLGKKHKILIPVRIILWKNTSDVISAFPLRCRRHFMPVPRNIIRNLIVL